MEKTTGRPRVPVDTELLRQILLNYPSLGWRDLAGKYYIHSGTYVSFMTLWRRYKESVLLQPKVVNKDTQ
jgi:hypothetical protein